MASSTTGAVTRTMHVPADEIHEVVRLAWRFCRLDERRRAGSVLVTDVVGERSWLMGHPAGVVTLRASTATGDGDWVVPKRLVHAAGLVAGDGDVTFIESTGDGTRLSVEGDGGCATVPLLHDPEPELVRWAGSDVEVVASTTVGADALARLVAAARWTPHNLEEGEAPPLFWLGLDAGRLTISVDWGPFGESMYSISGHGVGRAAVAADAAQLVDVLEVFDGEITVELTGDPDDVLILRSGDRRALIRPIETTHERFRQPVESVLAEVFGDVVLHRDSDGDYPISLAGAPIFARLVDDRPVRLHVFSILLDGIEASPELLHQQLNELNSSVRFVRLTWAGSQVLAEVDLVAEMLAADELLAAVERIHRVSSDVMPSVSAFFGGVRPDAEAARWARYGQAVIDAEVVPGRWLVLTGPDGVAAWELPDEVFVLTACSPHGAASSPEADQAANIALAQDVLRIGGRSIAALGRSVDGDHGEPSILVWGLPLEAARYLGREYHQDAIFRLTADEMALIACFDERVETWPRLDGPR